MESLLSQQVIASLIDLGCSFPTPTESTWPQGMRERLDSAAEAGPSTRRRLLLRCSTLLEFGGETTSGG